MSASEKLKALRGAEQSAEAAKLMRALPQIVALVEAAENLDPSKQYVDPWDKSWVVDPALAAALTDLEKALS